MKRTQPEWLILVTKSMIIKNKLQHALYQYLDSIKRRFGYIVDIANDGNGLIRRFNYEK
jgi:hypothetical protein